MSFVIDNTDVANMLIERLTEVETTVFATATKINAIIPIAQSFINCSCKMSRIDFHENGSISHIYFNNTGYWCNKCSNANS